MSELRRTRKPNRRFATDTFTVYALWVCSFLNIWKSSIIWHTENDKHFGLDPGQHTKPLLNPQRGHRILGLPNLLNTKICFDLFRTGFRSSENPPLSSAEVKDRVELCRYSPSGSSWPVLRWALPLLYLYLYLTFFWETAVFLIPVMRSGSDLARNYSGVGALSSRGVSRPVSYGTGWGLPRIHTLKCSITTIKHTNVWNLLIFKFLRHS